MFEWKKEYAVQISSIDAQHQTLFRIAGELHDAMMAGHGKAATSNALCRLVEYTAIHFAYEERLMRLGDYADFTARKAQLVALTRQVVEFNAGSIAMSAELIEFLRDWLERHVMSSEHRFAPYLIGKAIV